MQLWLFVLIIVVISSVIGVVFFIINERGKEKLTWFDDSKQRLEKIAQELDALMFLAKDKPDVYERIKQLQNQVAFAAPSENKTIQEWDKRIRLHISDLKIALVRARGKKTNHACNRIITQIELFLIERQQKID